MENTVIYRSVKKTDYPILAKIISDTWGYQKFCSEKVALLMGKIYLHSCLSNQSYNCVAERGGIPVGVIMGRGRRLSFSALWHKIIRFIQIARMVLTKEGRQVLNLFHGFDKIDQELLENSGHQFDGELTFFAVREDQRGMGIGKALFSNLLTYMRSIHADNFYLFTDTTCNYPFYERQGLKRFAAKEWASPLMPDLKIHFFLYAYEFPKALELHFQPITAENRKQAEALQLSEKQSGFVESVQDCMREADKRSCWKPVGIYDGNTLVGFAMYGFFWEYFPFGRVWLDRLLIDSQYQGKGYGKAAVIGLLKRIRQQYKRKRVYLSVYQDNAAAIHLYKALGFHFNGQKDIHGEDVMVYTFDQENII